MLSGYKLLVLVSAVSILCVLVVLCASSSVLARRRRRRAATLRDPEVTSRRKMAAPLCSNGKVATIHTASDKRKNNGHVRIYIHT